MRDKILEKIKLSSNQYLKRDLLLLYLKKQIFSKNILKNIRFLWIKNEDKTKLEDLISRLKKRKDIFIDEKAKDIYYKKRSLWCTYCTMWKGCTVVLSYKCHRSCFFCYEQTPQNPKVKIDPYNKKDMDLIYQNIDISFSNASNKSLAITGGEPLLFIDKVYEILEYVNKKYPWKHTRIYTTWDFLKKDILKKLRDFNLDEIRFSIKPWEEPNLKLYCLAKKYIPTTIIEMPVIPNSKKYMIDILEKIHTSKCIDGINLNELTFNNLNKEEYKKRNLMLDIEKDESDIFHRYFDVSKIEVWVYGSKFLALELIDYFSQKKSSFFIHYCDLDTVSHHHYIHRREVADNLWIQISHITKYGLHKILRVYWDKKEIYSFIKEKNIDFLEGDTYFELSCKNKNLFKGKGFQMIIIYKTYDYKIDIDFEFID